MRVLAAFSFAFALAVLGSAYVGITAAVTVVAAAVIFIACAALLKDRDKRRLLVLLAVGAVLGCVYFGLYSNAKTAAAAPYIGQKLSVTVESAGYAEQSSYKNVIDAYLIDGNKKIKLRFYGGDELLTVKPGDRITSETKINSAAVIRDNAITSFTSKGIWLLAYAGEDIEIHPAEKLPLRYVPTALGKLVKDKIALLYSGDSDAFITAILTGDKSKLSDELYSDMTETGIAHITAVSGMHCAFLFSLIFFMCGRRRKLSSVVSIPVLLVFMLMTGAAPSVVRACIMLIVLSLAPLFNRENDYPTALAFALLLILLQNPFAVQSVGLQLSFAAVTGLLLFGNKCFKLLCGETAGRFYIWRFVASSLSATFGATVLTLPLSMYYFGCFSIVAPLANLFCLWFASAAFALAVISVMVSFVLMLPGEIIAGIAALFVNYIVAAVHFLAHIPYHAVYSNNPYLIIWLLYAYSMFGACLAAKAEKRFWVTAALASALSLGCIIALPRVEAGKDNMTEIAVDVGQGAATVLISDGEAAVVDCGSSNSWIDAGDRTADVLQTYGCRSIDKIVLTHYHSDHANGLSTLLARVAVKEMILPDIDEDDPLREEVELLAAQYDVPITYISDTYSDNLGIAKITVYPPLTAGSTNEQCLAVLCSCGDFDTLIVGDMEHKAENALVQTVGLPKIEVLMVPHHGSDTSSGDEFLESTAADAAIISVGDNSYGHPDSDVIARLTNAGADIYRTDRNGDITVSVHRGDN